LLLRSLLDSSWFVIAIKRNHPEYSLPLAGRHE
jgi:hypothetical protein